MVPWHILPHQVIHDSCLYLHVSEKSLLHPNRVSKLFFHFCQSANDSVELSKPWFAPWKDKSTDVREDFDLPQPELAVVLHPPYLLAFHLQLQGLQVKRAENIFRWLAYCLMLEFVWLTTKQV